MASVDLHGFHQASVSQIKLLFTKSVIMNEKIWLAFSDC